MHPAMTRVTAVTRVRALACATASATALLGLLLGTPLAAQDHRRVLSSEVSLTRTDATLNLELAGGRTLDIAVSDGVVYIDGERIGAPGRGSTVDREWRALLTRAMDVPTAELPTLLLEWSGPEDLGARLERALEAALARPASSAARGSGGGTVPAPISDSVSRLVNRVAELEQSLERLERRGRRATDERRERRSRNPFRYILQGISGMFSVLVTYVVLFAVGGGLIFFDGRKYLEGVGDTARHATGRSLLVGIAALFLAVPAFVLGIIALTLSIVGIPGLLAWLPGFPLAVMLALLLGYLGVAHAAGESFAEHRFNTGDWLQRGNSYYFLLSGLGVLLALFLAAHMVHMAGPWLSAIRGMLFFLGTVVTGVSMAVGLGAVLISRAGTRPLGRTAPHAREEAFTEEAGV